VSDVSRVPKSIHVSLTPELTQFINARVASGRYQSASEVVWVALRLREWEDTGSPALHECSREPSGQR
jgi:antitoxin ParD1/3/4